ncbi:mechanosensitive ion channel [Vitreoscilla massiliensis]|uniref:Mechanosensitive ion channel n=1 Tax=Vitreoscilla massiliensis TaxID=1689272 RepID=A0ABY4E220_9NEIS|nr:mechanosensitive ion channel domain-containing protein [Vitreoscilla massiliensis]UOO89806.1 mechanosensitive ion channel [Vitreoscilla massiliensis]
MAAGKQEDTLQHQIDKLPDQIGAISKEIREWGVFDLFTDSIARREWTSHLIERSLNSTAGWVEFLFALALMVGGYFLLDNARKRHIQKMEQAGQGIIKINFFKHLLTRLAWPLMLALTSFLIIKGMQYFGLKTLWFGLLIVASAWMVMIRAVCAVLYYTLPAKIFNHKTEIILSSTIWVVFLMWITGATDWIIDWAKSVKLSFAKDSLSLFDIFNGVVWVIIIMMVAMWLAKVIEGRLMGFTRMDMSLRIALSNITKTLFIVLSFLIALPMVGIDLTVLSVFGGALGVGLGFGLQKVASNYVSGFIVLFDRSVRVGDRVNVNNFNGYVTKITTRYTVVKDANGAEALVPNENFIANMVINESYSGKALWRTIPIQVAYKTDLTQALAIMKAATEKQERVHGEASATLAGFADSGINLNVGFWVKDPENGFSLLNSNIMLDIWQQFNEAGIEFPYPQREIRILNSEQPAATPPKVHIPTSKEAATSNEPSTAQSQPEANTDGTPS